MRIFLCMPTYDGTVNLYAARAFYQTPSVRLPLFYAEATRSLLGNCFNLLWTAALNLRKAEGFTHFVMLHSDVIPEDFWVDRLYEEINRTQAAVVSTVLPIKDIQGITSTAISAAADEYEIERRLTLREVYWLPETFSAEDCGYPERTLLVNTGCWIADLSFFADKEIGFEVRDEVRRVSPNLLQARCIPEDWNFSRKVAAAGGKVLATRKIKAQHAGHHNFTNEQAWGMSIDPLAAIKEPLPAAKKPLLQEVG